MPKEVKESQTLEILKGNMKSVAFHCSCKLCKTFTVNLDFCNLTFAVHLALISLTLLHLRTLDEFLLFLLLLALRLAQKQWHTH